MSMCTKGGRGTRRLLHLLGILAVAGLIGGTLHALAAPAPALQEVTVSLKEWTIEPKEIVVKPGKVRFALRNAGRRQHNFSILGPGQASDVNVTSDNVRPGGTLNFEVELAKEGAYLLWCDIEGHRDRGMEGRLTVRR